MSKTTVTIVIPSFNEGKNIAPLLTEIIKQSLHQTCITRITVIDDNSTDNTLIQALSVKNKQIEVIHNSSRKGKARILNWAMKRCKTDVLVVLDGDIKIVQNNFIDLLVKPIIVESADLVSAHIQPLMPRNFLEKILYVSNIIKRNLFLSYNNGHNPYTCYGPARAFSRAFCSQALIPSNDGEDMYTYFFCITNNMKFRHQKNAVVYYRLPAVIADHYKQSIRYQKMLHKLKKYFGEKIVQQELTFPPSAYLKAIVLSFRIVIQYPVYALSYIPILFCSKLLTLLRFTQREQWNVLTSKTVR